MNLFTPFKRVTKTDYFGVKYETVIVDAKRRNLSDLWSRFVDMQRQQPVRDHRGQSDTLNQSWYETETNKQLYEQER